MGQQTNISWCQHTFQPLGWMQPRSHGLRSLLCRSDGGPPGCRLGSERYAETDGGIDVEAGRAVEPARCSARRTTDDARMR